MGKFPPSVCRLSYDPWPFNMSSEIFNSFIHGSPPASGGASGMDFGMGPGGYEDISSNRCRSYDTGCSLFTSQVHDEFIAGRDEC